MKTGKWCHAAADFDMAFQRLNHGITELKEDWEMWWIGRPAIDFAFDLKKRVEFKGEGGV
jgi:hypothetical protein